MTAATTLIGLPASPASAAPDPSGLVTLTQTFRPAINASVVTGSLACPAGYRLVGSGGGSDFIGALVPMLPHFEGATISVDTVLGDSALLTIICAPADQFTDVKVTQLADFGVHPGDFRQGVIRCQPGYYAFGGGGYFTTADDNRILWDANHGTNAPTADGNGWTFAGLAPSVAHKLVVVTQCAPRTGRDFLVQFGNSARDSNTLTGSYADCPAGYTAIAGGFYISNSDGSVSDSATPIWSVPTSHAATGRSSWFAAAASPAGTKVVALAQCAF
jgi:hypothetical protein